VVTQGDGQGPYLTVAELARRWATSRMTIGRRIRSGEIPSLPVGAGTVRRRYRIAREWVERQEQNGAR
jgi:excisionase family DNA binding protein